MGAFATGERKGKEDKKEAGREKGVVCINRNVYQFRFNL